MDNKGTVALTVGLGALGTVLAYYGYNHLNDESDDKDDSTINEPTKERALATPAELRELAKKRQVKKESDNNEGEISNRVALAIKEIQKGKEETIDKKENVQEVKQENEKANDAVTQNLPEISDKEKWKQYWANQYKPNGKQEVVAEYN